MIFPPGLYQSPSCSDHAWLLFGGMIEAGRRSRRLSQRCRPRASASSRDRTGDEHTEALRHARYAEMTDSELQMVHGDVAAGRGGGAMSRSHGFNSVECSASGGGDRDRVRNGVDTMFRSAPSLASGEVRLNGAVRQSRQTPRVPSKNVQTVIRIRNRSEQNAWLVRGCLVGRGQMGKCGSGAFFARWHTGACCVVLHSVLSTIGAESLNIRLH